MKPLEKYGKLCSENKCFRDAVVSNGFKTLCKRHFWDYCKARGENMKLVYIRIMNIESIQFGNWVNSQQEKELENENN